jgi:hypothetical protein
MGANHTIRVSRFYKALELNMLLEILAGGGTVALWWRFSGGIISGIGAHTNATMAVFSIFSS